MTALDSATHRDADLLLPDADASAIMARIASRAAFADLEPAAVAGAKRGVLDTLGVSLAATTLGEDAAPILDLVREAGGHPHATVLGYGGRTTVADAAFVFGALAHMLDYDDIVDEAVVHPSAAVVAAALPLAERLGAVSGADLINAIAVGQDLAVRLSQSLHHHAPHHGWLPSVTAVFGATATAARLLALTPEQTQHALGLALHQAGGSRQAGAGSGSSFRAVRDGFNARAGVTCALLARNGLRGNQEAFEGRYGLFSLYFGGKYERADLLDALGVQFRGARAGVKPWPSCRFSHVFIAPLLRLINEHDLQPDDIAQITAVSGDDLLEEQCEPLAQRARPQQAIDAKTSLPFQLGKVVVGRTLTLDDFTTAGLLDPRAWAVADRVRWTLERTSAGPTLGSGRVEVDLRGGRRLVAETSTLPGSADDPISWDALEVKFGNCVAHSVTPLSDEQLASALATLRDLESAPDVTGIVADLSESTEIPGAPTAQVRATTHRGRSAAEQGAEK
jgi:2-methylcitrate dehydratase PrpD